MFLSERREFPSAPCLAKKTWWQLASRFCWNHARPWRASELVNFLVGLRTYQHPGIRPQTVFGSLSSFWLCRVSSSTQSVNECQLWTAASFWRFQITFLRVHCCPYFCRPVILNRRATARYRALTSIIPGRERFSWNISFWFSKQFTGINVL